MPLKPNRERVRDLRLSAMFDGQEGFVAGVRDCEVGDDARFYVWVVEVVGASVRAEESGCW